MFVTFSNMQAPILGGGKGGVGGKAGVAAGKGGKGAKVSLHVYALFHS